MTKLAVTLTPKDLYEGTRNLEILRTINVRHQMAKIQLAGKSTTVDAQTASMLITVYDALSPANKVNFVAMLAHSTATFMALVNLGWRSVK